MQIVLHIGLEKTGTKTLQTFLSGHHGALLEMGALYPKALGRRVHYGLSALSYDPDHVDGDNVRLTGGLDDPARLAVRREELIRDLSEEIARKKPRLLLLSNELMSSRLVERADIARLAATLRPFSTDIRVIVYLRDQAALLTSHYATRIKSGGVERLGFTPPRSGETVVDAFLRRRGAYRQGRSRTPPHLDPLPFWFDFRALLDNWSAVFGPDALRVRRFDRDHMFHGDLVDDFARAAGLPQGVLSLPRAPARNVSPGVTALRAMTLYNRVFPFAFGNRRNPLRRRAVIDLLHRLGGPRPALDPDAAAAVRALFADSNAAVARAHFDSASLFE